MNNKVIKAGSLRNESAIFGNFIKHQVLNAAEQSRKLIVDAESAAADLIAAAEAESESIRNKSYQAGREKAEAELISEILAVKEIRADALQNVEEEILKLAVKLSEKIIGRELKADETARTEIVYNALRQVRQQEMLTVRVNAEDLPLLEQTREKAEAFGRNRYVDFVADQAVKEGGCIIESASGTVDARLETQLRILENTLLVQVGSDDNSSDYQ